MANLFRQLTNMLPAPLRNRYFLALALFFAYMIFFDRHDLLTQIQLQRMVNKLESDRTYYEEKIEEEKREKQDMDVNQERFARERYFMQRADEDVYIIVEEEEK
jgi:cell division protein FtsB